MLRTEKKCRMAKRGHLWSLKLVEAARRVRYWKTHKSDYLNKSNASPQLLSLGHSLYIEWESMSLPTICSRLTTARKTLHKAQQNAATLRNNYLEKMAQMQAKNNNTDIATIIKNIRHCEEVKNSFRILRSISKGQQGGEVSHILVRDNLANTSMYDEVSTGLGFQPAWVPMDDNDWVMSALLKRNKLYLHQAWETPCTQGKIKDCLGESGLGHESKEILEGKFDPNIASNMPALNHWLKHNICRVAAQGSIKVEISLQDYKDLFNSQDESTSSSPSGRHYGHYHAALVSDIISQVYASMMSIPFLMGFTPQRWQTAIDVMLKKDIGSPKITCLCIILIVEGDMNAIMKVIWNR